MRRLTTIVLLVWLFVLRGHAIAAESATATFKATAQCELFQSKQKRTNPGGLKTTIGATYSVVESLKADGRVAWLRVKTDDQHMPLRWVDAGCGTGRVAIELARRGVDVVGVDVDTSMLATARRLAPDLVWVESDLAVLDLGRVFDVVAMAGNVPLFTAPGTHASLVAGCARHVGPGDALVAGFQLGRGYELDEYDRHCAAAELSLDARYATWDRDPFPGDGTYAVSVHRR